MPPPTKDLVAYDSFLKGRYDWNLRRLRSAVAHFRAAVDRDPDYAAAHLALADSYAVWGFYGGISSLGGVRPRAHGGRKRRALEPDSAGRAPFVRDHRALLRLGHGTRGTRAEPRRSSASPLGDPCSWLALCFRRAAPTRPGRPRAAAPSRIPAMPGALGWAYGPRAGSRRPCPVRGPWRSSPKPRFPLVAGAGVTALPRRPSEAIETLEKAVESTRRRATFNWAALRGARRPRSGPRRGGSSRSSKPASKLDYVPPFDLARPGGARRTG